MGATPSKPVQEHQVSEKQRELETATSLLRSLQIRDSNGSSSSSSSQRGKYGPATADVSFDGLKEWQENFENSARFQLSSTLLSKQDWTIALAGRERVTEDLHIYNTKISTEGTPITSQMSSGRCWLFATTNVIRIGLKKKYNLDDFQLSQSYLFFYDHVEKSNYYLETMIELVDEPLDSRVIQFLSTAPENDGGQWDMASNLIEKYGLVPQSVYPESFNSSNSSKVDSLLTTKLREYTLELRRLYASFLSSYTTQGLSCAEAKALAVKGLRKRKSEQMDEVYRILCITCGSPKKVEEFTWEYYDKNGKFHSIKATPLSFYKEQCDFFSAKDSLSLIDDPRNEYGKLYTVKHLGNVWDGERVSYVNSGVEKMKQVAIALLKADQPVWFGCDVGQSSERTLGLMDHKLFDLSNAFGTTKGMTKSERLQMGDSAMTHAMTITAVHLDKDGRPVRWRVENSWGPTPGEKGYFMMTDGWFDEFVYQIVAHKSFVPKELRRVWENKDAVELPPWDPLGALA
ncbi:peptidase C1B, bleomycin hydrolase [Atractiella rhizophila]|nr:peptidase C1B, bleomycin hydrolase [Atractiella rhizophila]